jgi:hypothetical protein
LFGVDQSWSDVQELLLSAERLLKISPGLLARLGDLS